MKPTFVETILMEMMENEFDSINESKDRFIDQMSFLNDQQKRRMKEFFRKRPALENRFDWNKPDQISWDSFEKLANNYEEPVNPDDVPELSDKRDEGDGIVSYAVQDDRNGMMAVRYIIDTHWGNNANPWCLASRSPDEPFQRFYAQHYLQIKYPEQDFDVYTPTFVEWLKKNYLYSQMLGDPDSRHDIVSQFLESDEAKKEWEAHNRKRREEMKNAWNFWEDYNFLPKRIAFKNGVLLAFMAARETSIHAQNWDEFDYLRLHPEEKKKRQVWWDRQDLSHPNLDWAR